jgi:signal transduction histidine kinase
MGEEAIKEYDAALILLRCERELFALRAKHEQVVSWLRVTQSVPELIDRKLPFEQIYRKLWRALVMGLKLQRVAFFETTKNGLRLSGTPGPERPLPAETVAAMAGKRSGICNSPEEGPLRALAELVGLDRFVWGWISTLDLPPVMLVGGFDKEKAAFRPPFVAEDAEYFGHLTQHLETLLGNVLLVNQLEREKANLQTLNETLERKVEERTLELVQSNQGLAAEMEVRAKVEIELRQAQKLEAVGRLASGVAHEINTPVQFVSDSIQFVKEAHSELAPLVSKYRAISASVLEGGDAVALAHDARDSEEAADLNYLLSNVPEALERSLQGLERISTIVRSMKEFAHPDQKEMTATDLNHALVTTLTMARSEYKYIAEVETELGELPPIVCYASELNQVFLNLIVNSAHAIGDVVAGTEQKGLIKIRTYLENDFVVVAITDSGKGISASIRDRIFDPFFTTKEVGKGTGQGLAIARSVVVDKHGGLLTFESAEGKGTTFFVRLPLEVQPADGAAAG